MPVQNYEISEKLNRIADLLDLRGDNDFRVRSYRNAARIVDSLPRPVADLLKDDGDSSSHGNTALKEYRGIGDDLAAKIEALAKGERLALLDELEQEIPTGLLSILEIPEIGPEKTKSLHEKLGVESISGLQRAADNKEVRQIKGFGPKMEEKILKGIQEIAGPGSNGSEKGNDRMPWNFADELARSLVAYMKRLNAVEMIDVAGSYRRRKESVGDLDILVVTGDPESVSKHFVDYEDVTEIVSRGNKRSTIILKDKFQIDLRLFTEENYGAAMHYFTGSKAHNIEIRRRAVERGIKLNEYGAYREDELIAGKTEEEVFSVVDLPWIAPELRENNGEIQAAEEGRLPELITEDQIRGELHAHSHYSDGRNSIEEMALAAKAKGYEYIAITDHSKRVTMAGGLDEGNLSRQIDEIDELNEKLSGIRILKGIEVDILKDGSLDLPDRILEKLDLRVASVHYDTKMNKEKMTERVLRAMENPLLNIFAHPTGRLVNQRDAYQIDLEKVMKKAADVGVFLEINGNRKRWDLGDAHTRMAKEMGCKLSLGTDAHSPDGLDQMKWAAGIARRGWLEADDVINTAKWGSLKKLMHRQ